MLLYKNRIEDLKRKWTDFWRCISLECRVKKYNEYNE